MKNILIGAVLLVLAGTTYAAPVIYTSQALYLADLASLGYPTISEGFEDDAVWDASRSPSSVDSTTSQGLIWKSNYTKSTTGTLGGSVVDGTYGFFSNPHGNATDGSFECEPDENNFNDPCWQYDGWIVESAEGETLYGIGGWFTSTGSGAKVTFLLDGVNVNEARDGDFVSFDWNFVGVIDEAGFSTVEILELRGADYDQALIWGDAFTIGVSAVPVPDFDADGVADQIDNCTDVQNSDQQDTDSDGYGNICDGDLNNDGSTNTLDLNLYKLAHRSAIGDANYNVDADFNWDGVINTLDLNIYKGLHRKPPGPSCCAP